MGRNCFQVHVVFGDIRFHVSCWTSGCTSLLACYLDLGTERLRMWQLVSSKPSRQSICQQQGSQNCLRSIHRRDIPSLVPQSMEACHRPASGGNSHGVNSRRWRSLGTSRESIYPRCLKSYNILPNCFSKWLYQFISPPTVTVSAWSFPSSSVLATGTQFFIASVRYQICHLVVVLTCISLIIGEVEHLTYFTVILVFYSVKLHLRLLFFFFIVFSLLIEFQELFYHLFTWNQIPCLFYVLKNSLSQFVALVLIREISSFQ